MGMLSTVLHYKTLYWQLTKREILTRYRGSVLGILWSFVTPIFMLAVYTFFFSVVFKARWQMDTGNKFDFALILFAGLIPYQLFSECVTKAPELILKNINYVKKVVFPLQILPIVQMSAALFHMGINILVLLIMWFIIHGSLQWTIILFPLVNLSLVLFILGLVWFMSSIGVYVRDIAHPVTILTSVLLFLSPVFYSVNMIPEPYRTLVYLNPLTYIIERNRDILIYGNVPDFGFLMLSVVGSLMVAVLGYIWFQRTRKGFGDIL